ncbi:hypothetical protein HNR22_001711 [Micromonospora jinlongensis]|uniref:Uncharacterized protein n=1 Tax=Micromonospora jinlongensis TaxID=1287877 RepID=A0A7Z0BEG5_9ACTN|nr:DUF4127 family protein [Micromonospora jinlongensis]NYH41984.1 hypothetical protein [Micromonospora jinlongensis]
MQVEAYAHARAQGRDPLALTSEQKSYFDGWVSERLVPLTERYFAGHRIVLGRRGAKTFTATLTRFESARVELPWDRLFEVVLEPRLRLS